MSTNTDLFMAILAMDAYNRGYNSGLGDAMNGLGETGFIGNAGILLRPNEINLTTWQAAGFYAIAYDWNGVTVISYRGTDNATTSFDDQAGGSDIWGGYGVGAGTPFTSQAYLAAEFYKAVTGTQSTDPTVPDIIVTGHSMGGGLAGFIASLYGQEGYIFDNMAFEGAAKRAYELASSWDPDSMVPAAIAEALRGDFYNGLTPWAPFMSSNLKAIAVTGEFLTANRIFQDTDPKYLDSNGGTRDPFNELHSQALLVSLQYADGKHFQWVSVGEELWNAAFNKDVGRSAGFKEAGTSGRYDPASKLLTAIAYSALDSGSAGADASYGYVFGNTGIRAMFDDADELGSLVSAGKVSEALEGALPGLLQAVVQFAGLMANRGINYRDYQGENQPFDPLEGVIALSDLNGNVTNSGSAAAILKLSVNQDLWKLGANAGAVDVEILGLGTLIEDLLAQASSDLSGDTIKAAMQQLLADADPVFSATKMIGSVEFNLAQGPINLTLPELASGYDATHTALYVSGDASDTIHGSSQNNMIAGADGDDVIYGRLGRDLLLGGDGSDVFVDSVTERSESDGRQNEDDVYIGSSQYRRLVTNFVQWLLNGDETDVVRYTVDNLTECPSSNDLRLLGLLKNGVSGSVGGLI